MSDHKLDVSVAQMRADAGDLRQLCADFNAQKTDVFDAGRALDATWEGDASQKFAARLRQDEPSFDELYRVILDYCQAIEDSAVEYERTEAGLVGEIGRIGQ